MNVYFYTAVQSVAIAISLPFARIQDANERSYSSFSTVRGPLVHVILNGIKPEKENYRRSRRNIWLMTYASVLPIELLVLFQ